MQEFLNAVLAHVNFYGYIILTVIGFYAMITRTHLVRQLVGLTIFQTGIILFFISLAAKWGGDLPIAQGYEQPDAADYINPLPHALMLTAIVVAVATQGVAMALMIRIKREFGTLEEDEFAEADARVESGGVP